jgi:flagellar hook assembly protein FlgD
MAAAMKAEMAKPEHEVAFSDLVALVQKHSEKMTSLELLAVASNMVGKIVALQDQRTTTAEVAMEVVVRNVQQGNQDVVNQLMRNTAGAA